MKVYRDTIEVRTEENQQFLDITKQVRDTVGRSGIQNGTLLINSLHTTIAIFVNEFQSALLHDLGAILQRLISRRDGYRHDDRVTRTATAPTPTRTSGRHSWDARSRSRWPTVRSCSASIRV